MGGGVVHATDIETVVHDEITPPMPADGLAEGPTQPSAITEPSATKLVVQDEGGDPACWSHLIDERTGTIP